MCTNLNKLFTLKVAPYRRDYDKRQIIITAWDKPKQPSTGHHYIDIEVRHGGKVIFPRGQLYCGVNQWTTTDGMQARELVLTTVAMKPGDTDAEYFEYYTDDQKDWAMAYGEDISMVKQDRYCDESGECRSSK